MPCSVCHFDASIEPEPHVRAPDVEKLLGSDDAPMGLQLQQLMERLTNAVESLSAVDIEMERLSQELLALCQKRRHLTRDIADLKAVIHPIRRIPAEILSEIFVYCVQGDPLRQNLGRTNLALQQCPWVLTHVCRHWRKISTGSPSLWTDIRIVVNETIPKVWTRFLGLQLSRSCSLLLNLSITAYDWRFVAYARDTGYPVILSLLVPTSSRWRSLSLEISPNILETLSDITGFLDSLESLRLTLSSDMNKIKSNIAAFRYMPRLKILQAAPHLLRYLGPAIGSVESWHMPARSSLKEILQAFGRVPRIRSCDIQLARSDEIPYVVLPILINDLENLTLRSDDSVEIGYEAHILRHVTLPSLSHLTLLTEKVLDIDTLESFVERSSLRLQSLTIRARMVGKQNGPRLLAMFPELTSMTVKSVDDNDEILPLLASSTSVTLVTRLQNLTVYFSPWATTHIPAKHLDQLAQLRPQLQLEVIG